MMNLAKDAQEGRNNKRRAGIFGAVCGILVFLLFIDYFNNRYILSFYISYTCIVHVRAFIGYFFKQSIVIVKNLMFLIVVSY